MAKHTQTIRRVFDHFVGLVLKGLRADKKMIYYQQIKIVY